MRESGGGPGWAYESADRYSTLFNERSIVDGWTAVLLDGFTIALFRDAALATALKDFFNRSAQLSTRAPDTHKGSTS